MTSLLEAILGLLTNDAQRFLDDASRATLSAARTLHSVLDLLHDE